MDINDYYIQFKVRNREALNNTRKGIAELDRAIAKAERRKGRTKSGSKANNKVTQYIKLLQASKKNLRTLEKNLRTRKNDQLEVIVAEAAEKHIVRNVKRRFNRQFKAGGASNENVPYAKVRVPRTGRYRRALDDPRFLATFPQRDGIKIGVVSKTVLDEWTNLHINAFGKSYNPPTSYGDIIGYWMFQEFFGSDGKVNFKNAKTAAFVHRNLGLGGFERRPIMLKASGDLIADDETVKSAVVRSIDKMLKKDLSVLDK